MLLITFIPAETKPMLSFSGNNPNILDMKIHELKLQQPFFDDVYYNRKKFEVRKNDRNYKVGDRLKLIEFPSENPRYVLKDIEYILEGGQYGIEKDYVVLGLKEIPNSNPILDIKDIELSAKILGGGSEKRKSMENYR